jgi:hypothetical protein
LQEWRHQKRVQKVVSKEQEHQRCNILKSKFQGKVNHVNLHYLCLFCVLDVTFSLHNIMFFFLVQFKLKKFLAYLDTITKLKKNGIKEGQMEEERKLYGLQILSFFF